jgi:diguanylate cyclase
MRSIVLALPFLAGYPLAIAAATFALARRASRHNRMLARQTRVDASTGILNRPNWETAVDGELRRFKRGGGSAALMMIDIDHFKTINDEHGHLAGDEVIRTTAAVIQKCIREVDVPGRYGGDEFGLLLVHTGTHAALVAAERIRQRVAETTFERAPGVRCTLSIGIASATRSMDDVHAWISQADAALYQAKTLGRNQIVRL